MLQNAYLVAKIGADTAENERNVAEFCHQLATTGCTKGLKFLDGYLPPHLTGHTFTLRSLPNAESRPATATGRNLQAMKSGLNFLALLTHEGRMDQI